MDTFQPEEERWQQAVSGRLSKLRSMPVDAGRLADALQSQIPRPVARQRTRWLSPRSMRAVAASLLLVGALGATLLFATMSRPALASPAQMARMHEDLVAGKTPAVQVDSIEAANKVLAGDQPEF